MTAKRIVDRARALSLLEASHEASLDGILIIDEKRRVQSYNQRFIDMWGVSKELAERGDDAELIGTVLGMLVDPSAFLAKVEHLYKHPEERSHDVISLLDGRVFDRYSAPVSSAGGEPLGRVWYSSVT